MCKYKYAYIYVCNTLKWVNLNDFVRLEETCSTRIWEFFPTSHSAKATIIHANRYKAYGICINSKL